MGWRTIYIEQAHKLSLYLNNIRIEDEGEVYTVPIEDIDMLLLNNYKLHMTVQLLCKLSQANVCVVVCNKKQLPELMINPLTGNYAAYKMQQYQLAASADFRSELWREIVRGKIQNQVTVLDRYSGEYRTLETMLTYAEEVLPGDPTNREGLAAKIYFKGLYGRDFIRDTDGDDPINLALNYGYALVRAAVARSVVAKGFIPTVGIHHRNIYDHFNLADDLIEPYRPLVDDWVRENMQDCFFVREKRLELVNALNRKLMFDSKKYSILKSIPLYLDSVVRAFQGEDVSLLVLPGSDIVEECE